MTKVKSARGGVKGTRRLNQLPVRLPPSLRNALQVAADNAKRSLNSQMALVLESSLATNPSVASEGVALEPYDKTPLGVRLQPSLREALKMAAAGAGRSMNSEIVVRLALSCMEPVSMPDTETIPLSYALNHAWERLSVAVDALADTPLSEINKAINELQASKAACAHLFQQLHRDQA